MNRQELREVLVGAAGFCALIGALAVVQAQRARYADEDVQIYRLRAAFNRIDGIDAGAAVVVSGVRVGAVEKTELMEDYRVLVTMTVDKAVGLPVDSSASIQTDGLFGVKSVRLEPGGDEANLGDGGRIDYTQDSLVVGDLLDLIIAQGRAARADGAAPEAPAGDQ